MSFGTSLRLQLTTDGTWETLPKQTLLSWPIVSSDLLSSVPETKGNMPYISQEARERLLKTSAYPATSGELNFLVTMLVNEYLGTNPGYQAYNDAIGVLECAKLELYARRVRPYEDEKCQINGDVYV